MNSIHQLENINPSYLEKIAKIGEYFDASYEFTLALKQ